MFFFLLVGTKDQIRQAPGGATLVRHCPQCGGRQRFTAGERRRYLTLFFIPILPVGSTKPCYICNGCGLWASGGHDNTGFYDAEPAAIDPQERLYCPFCGTAFSHQNREDGQEINCPSCRRGFRNC